LKRASRVGWVLNYHLINKAIVVGERLRHDHQMTAAATEQAPSGSGTKKAPSAAGD